MSTQERSQIPACATIDAPSDVCKACIRGDAAQCWAVSEALDYGDLRKKALFNARGCERGHLPSCIVLGVAYTRGILPSPAGVNGVMIEETACREARNRCSDGELAVCASAAGCEARAHGTSTRTLRERLTAACDAGHGDACSLLAKRTDDRARRLDLTRRGCAAGSTWACTDLGAMQVIGLDPEHGRREGFELLARTCARTGALAACEGASGFLDWRWYDEMHGGTRPRTTYAPTRVEGEVKGPELPPSSQKYGRMWLRFCVAPSGEVERAEITRSSGRPDIDALQLALIREWLLEPRTTSIHRCWSLSPLALFD